MFDLNQAIKRAKHVAFLTGAGISTPSGIPDYRSKTGIYHNHQNPEYLLSHSNLVTNPESFYEFVKTNMYFPEARPNIIHDKIAEITNQKGIVITQNVDGLHTKAGAKHVIEFHGNLYRIYCQTCGQSVDYETYLKSDIHRADGGIYRPDIVLYEEGLDSTVIERSVAAVAQADLIIITGTSFKVSPFCNLIDYRNANAQIVVVNEEKLYFDFEFNMIQADALKVFAAIK